MINKRYVVSIIFMFVCSCSFSITIKDNLCINEIEDTTQINKTKQLETVNVFSISKKGTFEKSSLSGMSIDNHFLDEHFTGNIMQTLQVLPGVKAMSIGSGEAKPMIRGLGFNRMAVLFDGIKYEGQQWGDDHGVEIDQFSINRIDIIKGPAAIAYGSDAIGGAMCFHSNNIPIKPFSGNISIYGRTNNALIGLSSTIESKFKNFYLKAGVTLTDYADYKVTTDKIQYYSYDIYLKDKTLRNTAGLERNGNVVFGYINNRIKASIKVANTYVKSGFFADIHGIEVRQSKIDYDKTKRDINLPYHSSNHFIAIGTLSFGEENLSGIVKLAYQNNLRKEFSEPVSHGYMPIPSNSLERKFDKQTYTGSFELRKQIGYYNNLSVGLNMENQNNDIDGWGFIIPNFNSFATGLYLTDVFVINEQLKINAGMRYDFSKINTKEYIDWYQTPDKITGINEFKQRAKTLKRTFNSFIWSVGVNYHINEFNIKSNIGKSFRVPIAKELAADGINYHVFKYEKGNSELKPEEAYQADISFLYEHNGLTIQFDPFFNYFSNYIYLNPTSNFIEGLQLNEYNQCKVIRYGFEAIIGWDITSKFNTTIQGEYLYSQQISGVKKGYALPFSPPFSADINLKYKIIPDEKNECYVSLNAHYIGKQTRIVPSEKVTDGSITFNGAAGKVFSYKKQQIKLSLNANNIFNTKYYDHTSYYRMNDIPEPARNISLMIEYKF